MEAKTFYISFYGVEVPMKVQNTTPVDALKEIIEKYFNSEMEVITPIRQLQTVQKENGFFATWKATAIYKGSNHQADFFIRTRLGA